MLLCTSLLSAAELLWPLNIPISQSSSFAEARGMRFHAGIDLRTQRKNGFPVVAIADGFISRASVQFRGYGYALYIDHPELKARVVYGHLQDFQGPIKQYTDAKLKNMNARHGINDFFTADRFPVKKGQVIALSGETGMGPPHLHFEFRTLSDEPLAPALFGYRPKDQIFPVFHHFYIEPMSYAAVIDNSFLPAKYNMKIKNGHEYIVAGSPVVSGRYALMAGISDSNGEGNRFSVERVALSVNDQLVLERLFHKYTYDQNRQGTWVYDYFKSMQSGTGYVTTLFKMPYETLPFSAQFKPYSGIIDAGNSESASFKILAEDYGGNIITASGKVKHISQTFSQIIEHSLISDFKFSGVEQTDHSMIAVGRRASVKGFSVITGLIKIKDKAGKETSLPCIVKADQLEIAFPKEKIWQMGAWTGETRILPESIMVEPRGGTVAMEDGAKAVFAQNSLHAPMFCRMVKTILQPAPGGSEKSGILKAFSPVWTLSPGDKVFDAEVKVSIKPVNFVGQWHKLGVYNVRGDGKYSHSGGKVENGHLVFDTRTGGSYIILEDTVEPKLSYARKSSDYHLGPVYVFKVSDLGKGVDYLSAAATINSKKVEVYSDPDKSEIYVVRSDAAGKKRIELTVADHAGNIGKVTRNIE